MEKIILERLGVIGEFLSLIEDFPENHPVVTVRMIGSQPAKRPSDLIADVLAPEPKAVDNTILFRT